MTSHEHSVVVDRPLMTVYDQWTQFESYPRFMGDVDVVEQLDDAMTHWKVSVAGVTREYDARIVEQRPGETVAWESVSGPRQTGRVSFAQLDPARTRVTLRLDFEPKGVTERVGDAVGVVSSSVEDSLVRFKEFIEERGSAEGGWHGEIAEGLPVQRGTAGPADGTQSSYLFSDQERAIDLRGPQVPSGPGGVPDQPDDAGGPGLR